MPRWLLFTLISALLWCGWWMVTKLAADSVTFPQTQLVFAIGLIEIIGGALAVTTAVAVSCERIAQA